MVENPSGVSRVDRTTEASNTRVTRRSRYPVEESGDLIECSGEFCSSCCASFLADCIAVCCCPFAVVNLLTFAVVKVPWMMGRRCLGLVKKKCRMLKRKERRKSKEKGGVMEERDGNSRNERAVEGNLEFPIGFVDGEISNFCARFEAERVWLELYQVGHMGFGRVSFTGIQGKSN